MGRFTVQWLGGQWYIGTDEAAQRIEGDREWLDSWLLANGETDDSALDFAGSSELEQRFINEFGVPAGTRTANEGNAGAKGRHRLGT
jgi:hypothetical protein